MLLICPCLCRFDWRYVHGRTNVCVDDDTGEPLVDLSGLGRLRGVGGGVREWELNSGAYGQNKFFALGVPGVLQIDLLQYMRREYKLDSYSLNNVSAKFLDDKKIDLPAAEIFAKFKGSAADRALIAEYAVKDTELPLRLLRKLSVMENLLEMANAGTSEQDEQGLLGAALFGCCFLGRLGLGRRALGPPLGCRRGPLLRLGSTEQTEHGVC